MPVPVSEHIDSFHNRIFVQVISFWHFDFFRPCPSFHRSDLWLIFHQIPAPGNSALLAQVLCQFPEIPVLVQDLHAYMAVFPFFHEAFVQFRNPVHDHMVVHRSLASDLCDADPFHFHSSFLIQPFHTLPEILHFFIRFFSAFWSAFFPVCKCHPVIFFRSEIPLDQSSVVFFSVSLVLLCDLFRRRLLSFLSLLPRCTISSAVPQFYFLRLCESIYFTLVHLPPVPLTLICLIQSKSGLSPPFFLTSTPAGDTL